MGSVEYLVECYSEEDDVGYFCVNRKFKKKIPDYCVEENAARKCPKCGKREGLLCSSVLYPIPYEEEIMIESDVKCLACGFAWIERFFLFNEECWDW